MPGWDTKKIVLCAAGAAGAAAALYYLLREDEGRTEQTFVVSEEKRTPEQGGPRLRVETCTKEHVKQILTEIIASQATLKTHMKKVTSELREQAELAFEDAYEKIRAVQPEDPVESSGLSMQDFDSLLTRFQEDPEVKEGIARLIGVEEAAMSQAAAVGAVTAAKVIEVHAFMHAELEKVIKYFHTVKNAERGQAYDMKTVTLAAQAVVGAKVETKFGLNSDEIEGAVMQHHMELRESMEFAQINQKMQMTMAQLIGDGM